MSCLVLEVDFLVYSVFSFKGETIKEERKLFFPTVTSTTPPFLDPVWAKLDLLEHKLYTTRSNTGTGNIEVPLPQTDIMKLHRYY